MYDKLIPLSNSSLLLNSILIGFVLKRELINLTIVLMRTTDEKLNKKRNMVEISSIFLFFMVQYFTAKSL
jgi:hypothetical protein